MIAANDLFSTMEEARKAINRHVLLEGESYKVYKSDRRRHIVVCKDSTCKFRIRASFPKKKALPSLFLSTILVAQLFTTKISSPLPYSSSRAITALLSLTIET
jgi:hypothetical protein